MDGRTFRVNLGWLVVLVLTAAFVFTLDAWGRLTYVASLASTRSPQPEACFGLSEVGCPDMPSGDVRMRGFARRHTVEAALAWLDTQLHPLGPESIPVQGAAGRVLASDIVSEVDVPGFDRATMDGYAVRAESTYGASAYDPPAFDVVGEARPGLPWPAAVATGQAVRIMTGAPMPARCDAVVPAEWVDHGSTVLQAARELDPGMEPMAGADGQRGRVRVRVLTAVSPGKHVGRRGEDITRGTTVLERGRVLRPQDLGVLSSIGIAYVDVVGRPRVTVAITGNELLPCGSTPRDWHVTDANGPMLAALVARDGGLADEPGLVRDDPDAVLGALRADADVVIVSGGSSVGVEDFAPMLLARHGDLAIHGIAMRPSSPTGLGRLDHRLVFLLPGNPVSCLCAYDFFAGRAIRRLGGRRDGWPYASMRAPLARKISSQIGRLDYARVQVVGQTVQPLSVAGASVLSSTTRADGFVVVPADSEGFAAGTEVEVWLYA